MKILLATGYELLDQNLSQYIGDNPQLGIEVVGEVYYRDALNYVADDIEVVVISEQLPGDNDDFVSTVYKLREKGIRVVLLPGDPEHPETQELVRQCTPLGVYDYVYNDVTIDSIMEKILKPSTIKDTKVDHEALQENFPSIMIEEDALDESHEDDVVDKTTFKATLSRSLESMGCKLKEFSQRNKEKLSPKKERSSRPVLKSFRKPTYVDDIQRIIAVGSLWMPGIGVTAMSIDLAEEMRADLIDADLTGRGLGMRLNIPIGDVVNYDWRNNDPPIPLSGRNAYLLNPWVGNMDEPLYRDKLDRVINSTTNNRVVIDVGSDPTKWYARAVFQKADLAVLFMTHDNLSVIRAAVNWERNKYTISNAVIMVDTTRREILNEIESFFGMPCIGYTPGDMAPIIETVFTNKRVNCNVCFVGLEGPGLMVNSSGEAWLAINNYIPQAIIVNAYIDDAFTFISDCRRDVRLQATAIAVVGSNDDAFIKAGADDCFIDYTPDVLQQTKLRANWRRTNWLESTTDKLTGCFLRKYFDSAIEREALQYRETGISTSLIFVDIDFFKKVNDNYGHQVGDRVLEKMGQHLISHVRQVDIVARYGGEEFAIILPRIGIDEAYEIAERIRRKWSETEVKLAGTIPIKSTLSAGVAEFNSRIQTAEAIIKAADEAVYEAKNNGRNQIQRGGLIKREL